MCIGCPSTCLYKTSDVVSLACKFCIGNERDQKMRGRKGDRLAGETPPAKVEEVLRVRITAAAFSLYIRVSGSSRFYTCTIVAVLLIYIHLRTRVSEVLGCIHVPVWQFY